MDIENYRGYQIALNVHSGEFRVVGEDSLKNASLTKLKKELDAIIKETRVFDPFYAIDFNNYRSNYDKVLITSIRKDGRFMCKKGDLVDQISNHEERHYIVVNDKVEEAVANLASLDADINLLHKKKELIINKIKQEQKTLKDVKNNYL